ncbi:TIGR03619 family F420-dependent LLM class oxidoreductase [bacterium]|nr:TIGR03619 family F420-dependent LLM class oxidoreductase [bacterium]|tara:strand:+ start:4861 stop:5751 length:891 start_codon:yes stop_codon:yes gene_type:complete
MDLGIALPIIANIDIDNQLKIAIKAEQLGFKSVWASDHIIIPQEWKGRFSDIFPDPFIMLTAISQNTSKITLGTSAIILPYRNPIIVAKMLSTLDNLCNGRLICTVAPGWMKEEFDILGVPYEGRIPKTEEFIKILKNLWSENPDPFEGEFYTFKNVSFQPKPLQDKLQIWMGGNADGAIQRAVEYADGWQPIWFSPEELQNKILFLEKYADEKKVNINREIYNISLRNRILITADKDNGNNPNTALIGQKNEVFDKILAYRDLRIKEVVLDFISPNIDEILETMEIVGKELIPEL